MATYLLVHGGWHGGWCWKKVAPLLREAGHEVFTPTLTGLGERAHLLTPEIDLNTHVQDILGVLEYEDLQQVILVGHSYGGMVITAVADQAAARIAQLVYLDAFVPEDGQSLVDLIDPETLTFFQEQAQTLGEGWRVPPPALSRYGITQADDLAWMNPKVGPQPFKTFLQPVQLKNPGSGGLPRTYISCIVDQRSAFAALVQRLRTEAGWQYRELTAGHDAMVTAPEQLAALLLEIAGKSPLPIEEEPEVKEVSSPIPQPTMAEATTLRQLIMGFRITQLIHVAAKLGLADHLQPGPQTPQHLAQKVGAEPRALYRLLRALASLGIFTETVEGAFALTPLAQLLQSDVAGSMRGLAILYGEEWLWQVYGQMLYSVQTGQPAFEHVHGQSLFDYLHANPAAGAAFQAGMSGYSAQEAVAILAAYDFSEVNSVVDVGGGHGAFVMALLRAYPHLSAVVFDLPPVVEGAQQQLAGAGLAARATCVGGDFFTTLPSGGDLYFLKSVIHNWDDTAAVSILRACRQAMNEQGRLLVAERIIPPGNIPAEAKLFDINMLIVLGAQERTEQEYRTLFQAAGFHLTRVIPTNSTHSLIEGVPIVGN